MTSDNEIRIKVDLEDRTLQMVRLMVRQVVREEIKAALELLGRTAERSVGYYSDTLEHTAFGAIQHAAEYAAQGLLEARQKADEEAAGTPSTSSGLTQAPALTRHLEMVQAWKAAGHAPFPCSGHTYPLPNCPAPQVHERFAQDSFKEDTHGQG